MKKTLQQKFGEKEAQKVLHLIRQDDSIPEFAKYLFEEDKHISRNAAWVLSKLTNNELLQLIPIHTQLIDLTLHTSNESLRRLTLNLLERLPLKKEELRTDLLDFCLEQMVSLSQPSGIQSLCMKIADKMCQFYPELEEELIRTIEAMEISYYKPAVTCVRKKILDRKKKRSNNP